jgi:hypothetical protein
MRLTGPPWHPCCACIRARMLATRLSGYARFRRLRPRATIPNPSTASDEGSDTAPCANCKVIEAWLPPCQFEPLSTALTEFGPTVTSLASKPTVPDVLSANPLIGPRDESRLSEIQPFLRVHRYAAVDICDYDSGVANVYAEDIRIGQEEARNKFGAWVYYRRARWRARPQGTQTGEAAIYAIAN